jgi:hypothetical protein
LRNGGVARRHRADTRLDERQDRIKRRQPTERDQCQAKLYTLVEGFMGDDWDAYREAFVWLRDFTDQKNAERGRVMCGGNWYTPQTIGPLIFWSFLVEFFQEREQLWRQFFSRTRLIIVSQFLAGSCWSQRSNAIGPVYVLT